MENENAQILYKNKAVIHGRIMTMFPPADSGDMHLIVTTNCMVRSKEIKVDHRILLTPKILNGQRPPEPGHYIAVEGPLTEHGYVKAEAYYNATDSMNKTGGMEIIDYKNFITLYGTIESPPQPFRNGHLFTIMTQTSLEDNRISATHLVLATDTFSRKLNKLTPGVYVWLEGPLSIDKKVILSHLNIIGHQPDQANHDAHPNGATGQAVPK